MSRSPWLVPVTSIRRTPGARQAERRSGPVGELVVAGSRVPAEAEAEADVVLDAIVGGIEVSGTVAAPWAGECRRCLRPVTGRLEVEVRELYRPNPEDEEIYPLTGELLDLAPLVRDALLLELPLAPLCADDCGGLCPICGTPAAVGCSCTDVREDPRWAALDALRPPSDT